MWEHREKQGRTDFRLHSFYISALLSQGEFLKSQVKVLGQGSVPQLLNCFLSRVWTASITSFSQPETGAPAVGSTPRLWEGLGCAGGVVPGVRTGERSRGEGWEGTIQDERTHGSCCFVICQLEVAPFTVPALPPVATPHQILVWGHNCPGNAT